MTANASNTGGFQDLLNQLSAGKDRFGNAATNFIGGIDSAQFQSGRNIGPSQLPVGRAGQAGVQFYNAMTPSMGRAALIGGLVSGGGALLQGQNAEEVTGSTVGGVTASMLAAKATPALLRMGVPGVIGAAALNVAAPVIGGEVVKNAFTNIGNLISGPARAATQAAVTGAGNTVSEATNPYTVRNSANLSSEEIANNFDKYVSTLGEERAKNLLAQQSLIESALDAQDRQARTSLALLPAKTSAQMAQGALAAQAMGLGKVLEGGNQVLSNISGSNPYAQMLLG